MAFTPTEINTIYLEFLDAQQNFNKVLKNLEGLPGTMNTLNELEDLYRRKTGKLHDVSETYKTGDIVSDDNLYMYVYVAVADGNGALTDLLVWNKIQELKDTQKNGLIYPDATGNIYFTQDSIVNGTFSGTDLISGISRIDKNNFQVDFSETLNDADYILNYNITEYDEISIHDLDKLHIVPYDLTTTGFKFNYSTSSTTQTVRADRYAIIEFSILLKEV